MSLKKCASCVSKGTDSGYYGAIIRKCPNCKTEWCPNCEHHSDKCPHCGTLGRATSA